MRGRNRLYVAVLSMVTAFGSCVMHAQFAGTAAHDSFHDTSMLKPAAGSKVSVIVFEDLGCPLCARAHPIEVEAAQKYHVPLLRHDFPLAQHIWTFDGAVCARYLQDKVSPKLAEEYRSAVFLSQASIASKDDLRQFTQRWMQQHGQQMPFLMDPKGELAAEVQADYALGRRLNVEYTPTLVVVTRDHYQVVCGTKDGPSDPAKLPTVVAAAIAQTHP
ncbi:MAG: thioredoxin domain-containing protein [Edaphobacter sp.]